KKVWTSRCASCHGKEGEGGIASRLKSQNFLSRVDDKFFYRAIVEGRPGTAMPSWHFLTSNDVADLIAHLRSWQKDPPREIAKRPARGRAEFGEFLYQQACISCHGIEGRGGVGGQIGNLVFLSSASDEFLWDTIAYGKDESAMRGFLKKGSAGALMPLTEDDIDHLVAYLRKLQAYPRVEELKRPQQSASVALGKITYDSVCTSCHGDQGQGLSGPSIGNPDFMKAATDGYLIGTIILGRENTEMLSFYRGGNVSLSQEEVENVVSYLRTFEYDLTPKHRAVMRSISNEEEGKNLYLNHCAGCHGTEGKGPSGNSNFNGFAPSLNNKEFLHAADDGFLLATIALGRIGTPMRAFAKGAGGISELSADEINKIVSFIRSWEDQK
ncbi:MAG: c-type cytochrome, partial [Planctomycetota bacterium]